RGDGVDKVAAGELGDLLGHQAGEATPQARPRDLGGDEAAAVERALIGSVLRPPHAQRGLIAHAPRLPGRGGVAAGGPFAGVAAGDLAGDVDGDLREGADADHAEETPRPPGRYWYQKVLRPLGRMRTPKPVIWLSQSMTCRPPSGTLARFTAASVRFFA